MDGKRVYVAGTGDTKGRELAYVRDLIAAEGVPALVVDLSTQGAFDGADIAARQVAAAHPAGAAAVFTGERGSAVAAMAVAFEHFLRDRGDVAGVIGLGGSGGTALVTQAMRALPIGVPKLMVSTVASGNVGALCRAERHRDDVFGHRRRRAQPDLARGPGQCRACDRRHGARRAGGGGRRQAAVGLTMFGVTTPCVSRRRGAARRRLRSARLPRHRHRRAVDGEAGRQRAARRRDRRDHDRGCGFPVGGVLPCTAGPASAPLRARGVPYVGSLRRARHGQFRRARDACRSNSATGSCTCTTRR